MSLEYREDRDEEADGDLPPEIRVPFPLYTTVILVCIAIAMVAQVYSGLERSTRIAGFVKPAFLFDGEYWRIVTGAVLHGSFPHVLMNGYALFSFGRLMELLTNRAHLALVFLLSAVGGGLLSLYFLPDGTSVGASGGIVGVIGYLVVYAFRRRQFVSAEFRRNLLINIGFILVFGLVLFQIVDNYGHIGGLVTGIVYGVIQIPADAYQNPQNAGKLTRALGAGALGIYIAATAFSVYLLLSIH